FFFQAEDGIRDFHVTGVQTCALPISISRVRRAGRTRVDTRASTGKSAGSTKSLTAGRWAQRIQVRRDQPCQGAPAYQGELKLNEIGRASCRERVEGAVGGVAGGAEDR